ncbi:dual specificity protein phosphatase family protein [Flavobacterium luteum]|uniref:Dual specificity protein phosphatase family protein n=1 Tax=Flavobacterium luteum TaxID=2026654 RepID=A0A7J5AHW7_9FLAO|nr:dual specificity protein phosphatase family protein [Flavobacterium luteum]KAB1157110.1 dual specificity protein phosphatase family protein [Flavobacterium luteum]
MEKYLPIIITIIGNIIFYFWISKSIERSKIAYSGLFKEKVDIYRNLLDKTYAIKKELFRFQYIGNEEDAQKIMLKINEYIEFYTTNQPFLSDEMISDLDKIRGEFQEVFEKFYKHIAVKDTDNLKEFFEASEKLKSNKPFEEIERKIIAEMRKDLKVSKF